MVGLNGAASRKTAPTTVAGSRSLCQMRRLSGGCPLVWVPGAAPRADRRAGGPARGGAGPPAADLAWLWTGRDRARHPARGHDTPLITGCRYAGHCPTRPAGRDPDPAHHERGRLGRIAVVIPAPRRPPDDPRPGYQCPPRARRRDLHPRRALCGPHPEAPSAWYTAGKLIYSGPTQDLGDDLIATPMTPR
jgi:hypothetical protein